MMSEQAINSELRRMSAQLAKDIPFTPKQMEFLRVQTKTDLVSNTIENLLVCFRQIGDPANAPLIEHYLNRKDPLVAGAALWVLCWLGQAERLKSYILEAVEPGFPWDEKRDVASDALMSAGHHLRTHRDRDFAQLILRWATREENDMFYLSPPAGQHRIYLEYNGDSAQTAAGIAVGADPAALVDDDALLEASLKRFIAERQDGWPAAAARNPPQTRHPTATARRGDTPSPPGYWGPHQRTQPIPTEEAPCPAFNPAPSSRPSSRRAGCPTCSTSPPSCASPG